MPAPGTLRRADLVARAQLAVLRARIRALEGREEHSSIKSRFAGIVDAVAADFDVPRDTILSERRDAEAALARHVAMALAHRLLAYSLPRIGRLIGRDHTTVLHGIRRVERLGKADPAFAARIDALAARIEQRNCAPGQECSDPGSQHCRCHRGVGHREMARIEQTERSDG